LKAQLGNVVPPVLRLNFNGYLSRIAARAISGNTCRMRNYLFAATIAAIAVVFGNAPGVIAAEVLITKAEADRPAPPDLGALGTRGLTRGPRIEQVSPDPGKGAKSPFPLEIKFTTVDPGSVKVTYLKSPSVDLTPRLKTHITAAGIDLGDAEVPPGTHMIRIDVRDSQGRNGTSIIKFSVLP
jgi:hypothetical protein